MTRDSSNSMLGKAAWILESFPPGAALSLAEVCSRTALARSTVHRLLLNMTDLGWIHRNGSLFELGMPLFELGERVRVKHRLRSTALPFMQDLFAVTEQTVHLAVRDGLDVVYVEKIHGHLSMPLPSQTGGRLPLTCTGVGKAILAFEHSEIRNEILLRPLRRCTSGSIIDPQELNRQLEETRRMGVAIEREESTDGGCCVASAILVSSVPVAALSVSVPIDRFRPDLLAPAVRTAALAISRVLAHADVVTADS